jgi:hypothetical protein
VQQYFGASSPQAIAELAAYLDGALPRPLSQMSCDEAVVIRRGHGNEIVRRPDYLRDNLYRGLYASNPFYAEPEPQLGEIQPPLPIAVPAGRIIAFPGRRP